MELTGHVTEDLLIAYFSGELDKDRMLRINHHVQNCPPCGREFRIFKALFAGLLLMLKREGRAMNPSQLRQALRENLKKNQVFYSILHIPEFTSLLVACTNQGLVRVIMGEFTHFEFEEKLKKDFPRQWIVESLEETMGVRQQIEEYFVHKRREFELEIDERLIHSEFQKKVLFLLQEIPYGHFVTYGELARRIGSPKASRAVGMALARNPLPIVLPCHRVVAGKGRLGGFSAGIELKLKLLELENAHYPHSARQMDLFNPFASRN